MGPALCGFEKDELDRVFIRKHKGRSRRRRPSLLPQHCAPAGRDAEYEGYENSGALAPQRGDSSEQR